MNSSATVVFICCVDDGDRKGRFFQGLQSYLPDNTVSHRRKLLSSQSALHEQHFSLYKRWERAADKLLPSIGLYLNCSLESVALFWHLSIMRELTQTETFPVYFQFHFRHDHKEPSFNLFVFEVMRARAMQRAVTPCRLQSPLSGDRIAYHLQGRRVKRPENKFAWLTLRPWRWSGYDPSKCQWTSVELRDNETQRIALLLPHYIA
jgi:hypothetical protein